MRTTLDTNQLVRALMRPPELATFIHIRTRTITSLLHAEGILLTTIDDLLILLG